MFVRVGCLFWMLYHLSSFWGSLFWFHIINLSWGRFCHFFLLAVCFDIRCFDITSLPLLPLVSTLLLSSQHPLRCIHVWAARVRACVCVCVRVCCVHCSSSLISMSDSHHYRKPPHSTLQPKFPYVHVADEVRISNRVHQVLVTLIANMGGGCVWRVIVVLEYVAVRVLAWARVRRVLETCGSGLHWPVVTQSTVSVLSPPLLLPSRLRVLQPVWPWHGPVLAAWPPW